MKHAFFIASVLLALALTCRASPDITGGVGSDMGKGMGGEMGAGFEHKMSQQPQGELNQMASGLNEQQNIQMNAAFNHKMNAGLNQQQPQGGLNQMTTEQHEPNQQMSGGLDQLTPESNEQSNEITGSSLDMLNQLLNGYQTPVLPQPTGSSLGEEEEAEEIPIMFMNERMVFGEPGSINTGINTNTSNIIVLLSDYNLRLLSFPFNVLPDRRHPNLGSSPGQVRALWYISLCMYEAWALSDPNAISMIDHNLAKVTYSAQQQTSLIAHSANQCFCYLYDESYLSELNEIFSRLGLDRNNNSTDMATPEGLGNTMGRMVVDYAMRDGFNQDSLDGQSIIFNDEMRTFADQTNYFPVNDYQFPPSPLICPAREPLNDTMLQLDSGLPVSELMLTPDSALGSGGIPSYAMKGTRGLFLRAQQASYGVKCDTIRDLNSWVPEIQPTNMAGNISVPLRFLLPNLPLVDPIVLRNWHEVKLPGPNLIGSRSELMLIDDMIDLVNRSFLLDDHWKTRVEYWAFANGATQFYMFAYQAASRKNLDVAESAQLMLTITAAAFDVGGATFAIKRLYNSARPSTIIPCMNEGLTLRSWRGQYMGTGDIYSSSWRPYYPTPPFPEYPSGHSAYCNAMAVVLDRWFNDTTFIANPVRFLQGGSRIEPRIAQGEPGHVAGYSDVPNTGAGTIGYSPAADVPIHWATWAEAAQECSESRKWAGVHFRPADYHGRLLGLAVGARVWGDMSTRFGRQ